MARGWSWEDNKLFELALASVNKQNPDRWEVIAGMIGGKKSAEDVQKHHLILMEDLQVIESGELDHRLGVADHQTTCIQVEYNGSFYWRVEALKNYDIPSRNAMGSSAAAAVD